MGVSAFYLLYNVFIFLRKGTTGLTAQAYGAQDFVEVRASFVRPFVFAVVLGLAIATFHEPIMRAIFLWIEPPDEGTRTAASAYVAARVLGAPFALANYAVQGWLNGMQRSTNVLRRLKTTHANILWLLHSLRERRRRIARVVRSGGG